MSGCERGVTHEPSAVATYAVCLHDDEGAVIEFWCGDCVERVVYGLDDPGLADRHLSHRRLP